MLGRKVLLSIITLLSAQESYRKQRKCRRCCKRKFNSWNFGRAKQKI